MKSDRLIKIAEVLLIAILLIEIFKQQGDRCQKKTYLGMRS